MNKTQLILLCAGKSTRFDGNKMLAKIGEKTVLQTNLDNINKCEKIEKIFVVQNDKSNFDSANLQSKIPLEFVLGGETRTQSVKNALKVCDCDIVLIHDGARPFATSFDECIQVATEFGSAIPCQNVVDTIKQINNNVTTTLDRNKLFSVQTPQGFDLKKIKQAYEQIHDESFFDDSMVFERCFGSVKCYICSVDNRKITYQSDINQKDLRVGNGYDLHTMCEGRPLILGGIKIESKFGLLGHSDADVLCHAVIDSILSASGNADIGRQFPDTDESFKDANSVQLLCKVLDLVKEQGFFVVNLSATIICQSPKLAPFIDEIRQNLSVILETDISNIGISAKTNEKVGLVGENKAICVFSACLLAKK